MTRVSPGVTTPSMEKRSHCWPVALKLSASSSQCRTLSASASGTKVSQPKCDCSEALPARDQATISSMVRRQPSQKPVSGFILHRLMQGDGTGVASSGAPGGSSVLMADILPQCGKSARNGHILMGHQNKKEWRGDKP